MHDLGRQLKQMRVGRDMSQGEVAQAAGIHPTLLSRIESGTHNFELSSIATVLEVLGAELTVSLKKAGPIPESAIGTKKEKEVSEVPG